MTRLRGAQQVDSIAIDTVSLALAPEKRPASLGCQAISNMDVHRWMDVHYVCKANETSIAEVLATRKKRIECLEGAIGAITVAARDVRLQAKPRTKLCRAESVANI